MKIVLSTLAALLLIGCSENKSTTQESEKAAAAVKTESVKESVAVKKTAQEAVSDIKKEVQAQKTVVETPKKEVSKPMATVVDGAKLFKACSSCHGVKAEKKALGKSQVIAGWKSAKIVTALKGYKEGTYGGSMKAVMKGQASKLSDADIKALSDYISKL